MYKCKYLPIYIHTSSTRRNSGRRMDYMKNDMTKKEAEQMEEQKHTAQTSHNLGIEQEDDDDTRIMLSTVK